MTIANVGGPLTEARIYQVAALYIDPRGPYPGLAVDCWDEQRDARKYAGPLPVVAHPPCGAWGNLRHLSRGEGKDCGPIAVEQVRRYGGVLEQPAGSKLWEHCGLAMTSVGGDGHGFSVEVCQVSWGHVARKKTWLYFVGVDRDLVVRTLRTGGVPTRSVSGRRGAETQAKHPTWKTQLPRCSDAQRRRTPPLFAEWLCKLAETACV